MRYQLFFPLSELTLPPVARARSEYKLSSFCTMATILSVVVKGLGARWTIVESSTKQYPTNLK
eukprot:5160317-Ditylum_brightwellii.AAC.1